MKWQDIARMSNLELSKLDTKTLRQYASQLNSVANKRLKNLRDKGLESPATVNIKEKFSINRAKSLKNVPKEERMQIRAKELNEVREALTRAKNFLNNKTSTVKGYEKFMQDVMDNLTSISVKNRETNKEKKERQKRAKEYVYKVDWTDVWKVLDRIKDVAPVIPSEMLMAKVIEILEETNGDIEDTVTRIRNWAHDMYEKSKQGKYNEPPRTGYARVI